MPYILHVLQYYPSMFLIIYLLTYLLRYAALETSFTPPSPSLPPTPPPLIYLFIIFYLPYPESLP
jgi:hypothetical protein